MFEQDAYDELDDFDSKPLAVVAYDDHSYLKSMWGGFRSAKNALAEDTILAHGMVQSFVNAFARDGHYVVVFDHDTATAGTDMKAKFVAITPGPIADRNLTAEEAGIILTAIAVHEISHPRYGRMTAQAVSKVFPSNYTADRLSNLLDDIRIERRFVEDYPGYAGIFDPALDYIGAAGGKKGVLRVQKLSAPVNLAIAATRYAKFSDWSAPALQAELLWWNDWAVRGSVEDAPKRHVGFIREALLHIVQMKAAAPLPQKPVGAPGPLQGGKGQANDVDDSGGGSEMPDEDPEQKPALPPHDSPPEPPQMSDHELNNETKPPRNSTSEDQTNPASPCSGAKAAEKASLEGDTSFTELKQLKEEANEIIEAARNREEDGHGLTVDVNRSLRGIGGGGGRGSASPLAAKYIRNAIMQSRTGHTDHEPFKRHGRLDQRGLERIAKADYRLFEKRTAPSVGRYNMWVMVDLSSSMTWSGGYGHSPAQQAAGVAHAMAAASQSVPNVRMSLWAWTDPFRGYSADAGAALAWKTGQPVDQALRLSTVKSGGTPDSIIMGWSARAIIKETLLEETPVIIFVSDGDGMPEMNDRIKEARKMGIEVYGVAFGHGMDKSMEARFGRHNYVPFKGTVEETARPLAKLFAKITGGTR